MCRRQIENVKSTIVSKPLRQLAEGGNKKNLIIYFKFPKCENLFQDETTNFNHHLSR